MKNFIRSFCKDEDGAVTVDWVVLTAAVVGLGVGAIATVQGGTGSLSTSVASAIAVTSTGTP
ncbi:MAG: hypothetical protein AAGA28_14215 [Pseudomonadota bacterium]